MLGWEILLLKCYRNRKSALMKQIYLKDNNYCDNSSKVFEEKKLAAFFLQISQLYLKAKEVFHFH